MTVSRQVGLGSATALVAATMIGTGVFTTSGFLLADLKSPWLVLLVWLLGGVLAALGALSYGALARKIPESGGEYTFLSKTLHPRAGHIAGWISLLVGFSAPLAAGSFAFGEYAKTWFPGLTPKLTGSLLLLTFSTIHALHVRRGVWVQNAAVLLKVLLIALFAGLALMRLPALPPVAGGDFNPRTLAVSLVWVSFSYAGWNSAVYIGGEVRNPERNLPLALLLGTLLVTALYVALNTVFVFCAPMEQLAGKLEVGRLAAEALGGRVWAEAFSALIAVGLFSFVSSLVFAGPRVFARMAEDGYLPHWLVMHGGPPRTAIALQTGLALLFLWSATYQTLLTFIGFTLNFCTAATVLGLIRLRGREGASFRVPGWPWVPWLFLTGVLAISGLSLLSITLPAWRKVIGWE